MAVIEQNARLFVWVIIDPHSGFDVADEVYTDVERAALHCRTDARESVYDGNVEAHVLQIELSGGVRVVRSIGCLDGDWYDNSY